MQEQEAVFGQDLWSYNLEDNRKTLKAAVRYAFDQGVTKTKPPIDELFVPSSLQKILHYL